MDKDQKPTRFELGRVTKELTFAGFSRTIFAPAILRVQATIGGSRSQHSFWSVQHENVLLLQRIAKGPLGSYDTGKFGIRFDGADLQKVEEEGWIFSTNGKAYVGVKFLDGEDVWNEKKEEAYPAKFTGQGDAARILLHAGDASTRRPPFRVPTSMGNSVETTSR
jgi:hypothetical protein